MPELDKDEKRKNLNRLKRTLAAMEATANAVPGLQRNWSVSHSQVLTYDEGLKDYAVVALRPYAAGQAGFKLLQRGRPGDDMRHIAQCCPATILALVKTLREIYPELAEPAVAAHSTLKSS